MFDPFLSLFVIAFWPTCCSFVPCKRQEHERIAMLTSNLKKNDEVLTHSGIYGTVVDVSENDDKITVRVADNVASENDQNSILRNLTNEEAAKEAKAAKAAKKRKACSSTAVTTKEGGA